MKIYLASSKRNTYWHGVKRQLEAAGHTVFDWTQHFTYGNALPDPDNVSVERMRVWLHEEQTSEQFNEDYSAIQDCDAFVLLLPCGFDAHMELVIAAERAGFPPRVYILALEGTMRATLFYRLADDVLESVEELLEVLE